LSGNDIGSIIAADSVPNASPQTHPAASGVIEHTIHALTIGASARYAPHVAAYIA
jgi:hypothetical protein